MTNTQEALLDALLAIALSQSKTLQVSYLVQADTSPDWKEGRVIRKPDGTFLKWKPAGDSPFSTPGGKSGKLGGVKPEEDVQEGATTSAEELGRALEKQSRYAQEMLEDAANKVKTYRTALDLAKDPNARQSLDREMRAAIEQVAKKLTSDEDYVKALESQVRKDADQQRVEDFKDSLSRLIGSDRLRQGPKNIAKSALKEGKAGADALSSPQGRIAAATAGTVAIGVLVAALNRRKALDLIANQVGKAAAKVASREAAKEAGAAIKDVGPIAKTLAKAEDSIPVVGAMIRSHRKERAISVSKEIGREAKEKAEQALVSMQKNDFDKAWDEMDDVFASVSDSVQKTGVVDTLADIVNKPYSGMKKLKLQSGADNAASDVIMAVALNTAGLGDDDFLDELIGGLKSAGFELSAEDIETASETLNNPSLMKRLSRELVSSMCKY